MLSSVEMVDIASQDEDGLVVRERHVDNMPKTATRTRKGTRTGRGTGCSGY